MLKPDEYLRPEMNASVAFVTEQEAAKPPPPRSPWSFRAGLRGSRTTPCSWCSTARAVQRTVKTGPATAQGMRVEEGLNGGEDLIVNPPADLKEGEKVRRKQGEAWRNRHRDAGADEGFTSATSFK